MLNEAQVGGWMRKWVTLPSGTIPRRTKGKIIFASFQAKRMSKGNCNAVQPTPAFEEALVSLPTAAYEYTYSMTVHSSNCQLAAVVNCHGDLPSAIAVR